MERNFRRSSRRVFAWIVGGNGFHRFQFSTGKEGWKIGRGERGTDSEKAVGRDEANDGGLSEDLIGKSGTYGTEFPWRLSVRLLYMDG